MSFIKQENDHFLLYIKVVTNSVKTKILGKVIDEKNQTYLKISLAAIPEDGKANTELVAFLAKILGISKSKIAILRGETSRNKTIKISQQSTTIQSLQNLI